MTQNASVTRQEIVFVFDNLPDWQQLAAGVQTGVQVVVLDGTQNGLSQIAAYVQGLKGVDAIHLLSHGAKGTVQLGSTQLTSANLAEHQAVLESIGAALGEDADLLLYGCNVAADESGALLLENLAKATGADVAASTDLTGATFMGGDWVLEKHNGTIETDIVLSGSAMAAYEALLATGNGTADGDYDFSGLIGPANGGFRKLNDKLLVSDFLSQYGSVLYASDQNATSDGSVVTAVFKAEGTTVAKSFTFNDFSMSVTDPTVTQMRYFDELEVVLRDVNGHVVGPTIRMASGADLTMTSAITKLSTLLNSDVEWSVANVASVTVTASVVPNATPGKQGGFGSEINFNSLKMSNITAVPSNVAPVFVGVDEALDIAQNSEAFDMKSLLHVSDSDSDQLLMWTIASGGEPSHGTVTVISATGTSGNTDIAPGGTFTYKPASGFAGTDTFTVQVSDGTSTTTRTVSVNVAPITPGMPDLAAASDSGIIRTDNITNASSLTFSGTSAAGDSLSSVRVFLDVNGNGVYDAGTDASSTSTVNNGAWTVAGLSTAGVEDNVYNVYAVTTSSAGGVSSAPSSSLAVTIDKTPPGAPNIPIVMDAASDSGSSTSDGITNVTNPLVRISLAGTSAAAGDTVELLQSGASFGTPMLATLDATNISNGFIDMTIADGSLGGDGSKVLTSRVTDIAGNVGTAGDSFILTLDTNASSIASVAVPANDTYRAGHQLEFTVNFSEAVIVDTTGGEPRIAVTLDTGGTTYASYVAGSGTSALVFRVVVQTGWQDTNGIALGSTIDLNGGSLQDSAGNIAALSLNSVGALSGVLVNAVPPVVSSINLVGTPITSASSVDYTVVFSKAITGLDTSDFVLGGNGVTGSLSSVSGSGTTYTVTVSSIAGNGTLRLDLNSSGTGITDSAGNAIAAGYTAGGIFTIDKTPPGAPSSPIIMAPFSDSGSSDSDGITNITSPLVRISLAGTSAVAGDGLEILLDGNSLGTPLVSTFTDTDISNGYIDIQMANGSLGADGNKVLTARVTDIAGNVGAAGGSFTITLDTTIDAPSAPVLAVASDSGSFDSDRITNVTTPTLTGTAEAGSTVTLYDTDGTTVLRTTTAASGVWSITSSTLADGAHSLTVTATDLAGNVSAPSADLSVIIDTAAPVFSSAAVNGKTLVLNYTETSMLDPLNLPAPGAFNVLVGSVPNAVTAVAVDPVAKTVTLTLTNAVAAGNAVTVAYEDLSADNDANAIQDLAGNDAATLTATAVTNNTPAPPVIPTEPTNPTVPPVVSVPVDGVNVTTTTGDGGTTIITVPVVRPTRVDDPNTPDSGLADIPIVKTAGGRSILEVGVPVGVEVKAQGVAAGLRSDAALNELLTRIESAGGNTEQLNLGRTFDSTVSPTTTLHIQTLTLSTGAGFDTSVPLVVRGSALPGDGLQAVILDARALPSGSVIQVDNVDFVTVIGSVRIIGGAGQNMATGDGGAQYIVLGADDDVIHGGGGNDTVGSKGGNDNVYGDAGDDTVFGGAGNDQLSGGSGSDRLNGGTGFDVAIQEGKRTDYTVVLDGAGIKLTHVASGVSDWLVDVEQLRFDTGPSLTIAHSAAEEAAAFLFRQWMGRDLTQSEGAVIQTLDGLSAVQVADLFIQVFPQQAGGKTAQQLLEGMEAAGAIRVDADRSTKYVGDAGDNTFTPTLGLAWNVDGGAGIDTLVFPATLAETHIEASATGFTLQRMIDGAMLELTNVERLTLNDTKLALDLDGHAGQAAKLLGALGGVGLLDNKPLVGEVIRALDAGVSAQSLAQLGLQVLGAKTSLEITQLIWTNVVGSAATPAQLQPFVNMMAQGVTGGELAVLASNLDLNATRIDLVGLAATGIEFA